MLYIDRVGHFYGQCSELCGVNHGFMPIEIYAISKSDYISYLTYVCEDFTKRITPTSSFFNSILNEYFFNLNLKQNEL
jgi:hypothetical protein